MALCIQVGSCECRGGTQLRWSTLALAAAGGAVPKDDLKLGDEVAIG